MGTGSSGTHLSQKMSHFEHKLMLKWVPECLSPAFLKSAKQIREMITYNSSHWGVLHSVLGKRLYNGYDVAKFSLQRMCLNQAFQRNIVTVYLSIQHTGSE